MRILVLNRGSSSLKCSLFDNLKLIWEKKIEGDGKQFLLSLDEDVDVIGHRIVHGGKKYRNSVLIDAAVKRELKKLAELAPLHNRADLEGIQILEKWKKPQVAVFDTSFHQTMPKEAVVYPGPYEWIEEGIIRYGFHGMSFQYCAKRAKELKAGSKLVICHLGSGASLCAVQDGKSVDTTMGYTPLEGLMMDTRSGTVDPGIILHLLKKKSPKTVAKILNEKSGLLGLAGFSDMRDVVAKNTARTRLALNVYIHRLTALIGSMVVSLGGIDSLIFTGGIGENNPLIRKKACEKLKFLGVDLDDQKNRLVDSDSVISSADSKVKILMIHTKEDLEIARSAQALVSLGCS
jgi:acetate kinase